MRELLRDVWGELFNRADGPSIRSVTDEAIIRIHPHKTIALARTQRPKRFRLDLGCVSDTNWNERMMGNLHVGVISRVFDTMLSNTSLTLALPSLKLSAPAMAAVE